MGRDRFITLFKSLIFVHPPLFHLFFRSFSFLGEPF
jgi:hypothetical protein